MISVAEPAEFSPATKGQVMANKPRGCPSISQVWAELCGSETETSRRHHLATAAAYLGARLVGEHMVIEVGHSRYASMVRWIEQTLASPLVAVEQVGVGHRRHRVTIADAAKVLARYGYRHGPHRGHWVAEVGPKPAKGVCRGAIHAAGMLSPTGLHIGCPSHHAVEALPQHLRRAGKAATTTTLRRQASGVR
jgi:hypothetical protein